MSLFDRIFGKSKGADATSASALTVDQKMFQAAMFNYPPWQLPHLGAPSALTDTQLADNLAWFEQTRAVRIAAARRVLGQFDVKTGTLNDRTQDGGPALIAAQRVLRTILPPLDAMPNAPYADTVFWTEGGMGPRIVYAFAADLGTMIGQAIIARRPKTRWGINTDRSDIGMPHYRLLTLILPPDVSDPGGAFDMIGATIGTLVDLRRSPIPTTDDLAQLLTVHTGGAGSPSAA